MTLIVQTDEALLPNTVARNAHRSDIGHPTKRRTFSKTGPVISLGQNKSHSGVLSLIFYNDKYYKYACQIPQGPKRRYFVTRIL